MTEIYDRAVDIVRDEMAKQPEGSGIAGVGEIVTDLLPAFPQIAGQIVDKSKTLSGAYKALEDYARKNKKGVSYYMSPGQAMRLICDYFGVESGEVDIPQAHAQAAPGPNPEPISDLDALLEGL